MRLIISFVVILAPHAFAIEPAKGQLNGLDRRQTADYCGTDTAGFNLWCIDSTCCENTQIGIWSCSGPNDQCCATGYTCPNGSQCYLDSLGYQWCIEGSNTVAAPTGSSPKTSAGSASPTKTAPSNAQTTTAHSGGAGGLGKAVDALAKIVPLAGAAALLL